MSDLFERLPKYVQIKEAIRKDIEQGVLKEDQQLPSEATLIERFNASKMTVIRALQELVQEGYLRRVQGKGTYVMRPVQDAPLIGVLVPGTDQGIFPIILHSIESYAHQLGYELLLCNTDDDMDKVKTFAERLIARQAAGVIAAPLERVPHSSANLEWYEMFQQAEIPVVLLDRGIETREDIPLVCTNNKEAMAQLTREIIKHGHRRILLFKYDTTISPTIDARISGFYEEALHGSEKAEIAELVELCEQKPHTQLVQDFENILCEYEPTCLMTLNDLLAIHVFTLLKNVGSSLSANVSIVGFDDLPFTRAIGLTTVRQPLSEEGRASVEILHDMIQGRQGRSKVFDSEIIIRSSLVKLE